MSESAGSSAPTTPRTPGGSRQRAPSSPRGPPPPMPAVPPPPMAHSTLPANLPPPPPSSSHSLPPPPASPTSEKKDKEKDKKTEKAEKEAAKAAEKDRKKAEKEAEKEAKKKAEADKKKAKEDKKDKKDKDSKASSSSPELSKKGSSASLGTPSDSSSEPGKEDRKKAEEDAEELSFSAVFDKQSFLYNRAKNFPAPEQLEGKYRIKTTSWADRWLVLYCDFILYYELKGATPKDFDKPLGALRLDSVVHKKIKDFEARMDVSGLIPKTIMYDFCFEVPIVGTDGKERIVLLQFDRAETQKAWREKIKAQAKNIEAVKAKVNAELKTTIEMLANKFPISNRLKESPYPGDEEKWVKTLKDHWHARNKYRKDLRRAQLFSEFYVPNYKAYIDWFVTSGGEAGVASLEKELMLAEDSVISGWKNDFCGSLNAMENEIDTVDQENEPACRTLLQKVQRKLHFIAMHVLYMKETYPTRDADLFEEQQQNWKAFEGLLQGYLDTIYKSRLDENDRMELEAKEAHRRAEAEHAKREEERRNDPFGNGDDDDPFADTKVVNF